MTRRASVALAVVLALAGCSSSPPSGAPAGTSSSATAPGSSAAASTSSVPSPTVSAHAFGQSVPLGKIVVATAYAYRQPVASAAPAPEGQPGYQWGGADVQVCAGAGDGTGQGISVSRDPWALVYDDNTTAAPSNTGYSTFPQPAFPDDHTLAWGRCIRGWIVFPVPASKRPRFVEYQPRAGSSVAGQTIDWAVR